MPIFNIKGPPGVLSEEMKSMWEGCSMPIVGRLRRISKEPKPRDWGDPLFDQFLSTLATSEREHVERACFEYFPSQKNIHASYYSTRKYDRPQPVLDRQLWDISYDWTVRHFLPAMGGAVLRDPEICAWNLRRWTTPGYPWCWVWPTKGQALDDERFWDYYRQYRSRLFADNVLWGSTVKSDELRPPEKIELNELRTFLSAPIHHNIATMEMCSDMNERLYNSTMTFSAIGTSNYNGEWHHMTRQLVHENNFGSDLSNQDASMWRELMYDMAEFRFEMLKPSLQTEENWVRLENIYRQIVDSLIVLANGEIVMKDTGNPSGCGNTITDNTVGLYRAMAYAWLRIFYKKYHSDMLRFRLQQECQYTYYNKNVRGNIIGDDGRWSVSKGAVADFNPKTIAPEFAEFYMIIKFEFPESRPITDIEFLSHKTLLYMGKYVPALDYERGVASLAWKGATLLDLPDLGARGFKSKPANLQVHYTLQRALDLRREGFWNKEFFDLADRFARWILKEYQQELQKPAVDGPLAGKPLEDILASFLPDRALEFLYTRNECEKQCQLVPALNVSNANNKYCECSPVHSFYSFFVFSQARITDKKDADLRNRVFWNLAAPVTEPLKYLHKQAVHGVGHLLGKEFHPDKDFLLRSLPTEAMSGSHKRRKKHSSKGKRKGSHKGSHKASSKGKRRNPRRGSSKPKRNASLKKQIQRILPMPVRMPKMPSARLRVAGRGHKGVAMRFSDVVNFSAVTVGSSTHPAGETINIVGGMPEGTCIAAIPMNPVSMSSVSLLKTRAVTYRKFKISRMQLRYVPQIVPGSTGGGNTPAVGSIAVVWDDDTGSPLASVGSQLREDVIRAHRGRFTSTLLEQMVVPCPSAERGFQRWYDIAPGTDARLSTQAYCYVFLTASPTGTTQYPVGKVFIEGTCHFLEDTLAPTLGAVDYAYSKATAWSTSNPLNATAITSVPGSTFAAMPAYNPAVANFSKHLGSNLGVSIGWYVTNLEYVLSFPSPGNYLILVNTNITGGTASSTGSLISLVSADTNGCTATDLATNIFTNTVAPGTGNYVDALMCNVTTLNANLAFQVWSRGLTFNTTGYAFLVCLLSIGFPGGYIAGLGMLPEAKTQYDRSQRREEMRSIMSDMLLATCICGLRGCSLCFPDGKDTTPSTCPLCIERYQGRLYKDAGIRASAGESKVTLGPAHVRQLTDTRADFPSLERKYEEKKEEEMSEPEHVRERIPGKAMKRWLSYLDVVAPQIVDCHDCDAFSWPIAACVAHLKAATLVKSWRLLPE